MNDQSPIVHSLDARYYTDPQMFQVERSGLLARTWQFGCHLSELSEIGSYVAFEIAGESLFAIRGRDEQIRVFAHHAGGGRTSAGGGYKQRTGLGLVIARNIDPWLALPGLSSAYA